MVLPQLLDLKGISINISPLKRLQTVQAANFLTWGIWALCINKDTPDVSKLWNVRYSNPMFGLVLILSV